MGRTSRKNSTANLLISKKLPAVRDRSMATFPILVGGDTDAAIRRAVWLADGYFPGEGDTQRLAALWPGENGL